MNGCETINNQEQALLGIFQDILGENALKVGDDLSNAGLDSLTSVAASMMAKRYGFSFKPSQIVECGSISALLRLPSAEIIGKSTRQLPSETDPYDFTPTQQFWSDGGFAEHYNICGAWKYDDQTISMDVFADAVEILYRHEHELRTEILQKNGKLFQQVRDYHDGMVLEHIDLSDLPVNSQTSKALEICNGLQTAFEFKAGKRLSRFINFKFDDEGKGWIFIIVHHFTVDGFGWGNLLRKLSLAYETAKQKNQQPLSMNSDNIARNWSVQLRQLGCETKPSDLEFWNRISPATTVEELAHGCPDSTNNENVADFNRTDASILHLMEKGTSFNEQITERVFRSQASVIGHLDQHESNLLLKRNWATQEFTDFDVFAISAANALKRYCHSSIVWMDMLAATRDSIFPSLDTSSCLGYISELTPFWVNFGENTDLLSIAQQTAKNRLSRPFSGVGLRAAQNHAIDKESLEYAQCFRLPQIGINYHASLLHSFGAELLNLSSVDEYLGPVLDENGITYKFWFRVSYNRNRTSILLRYDPTLYGLKDAESVMSRTITTIQNLLGLL